MIPRKETSTLALILGTILGFIFIAVMYAASPLIALLVGMFIGWVLEVFTGDYVVQAFNALGLTGVQSGDLPKVFGVLAVAGGLFKMGASNASKAKKTDE